MTVPDTTFDPALAEIAEGTAIHLCSSEPANHAGIAAVTLGNYTLTAGDGNGDWTIANGDTSGRKITLGAQSGNNATGTGSATHYAVTDGSVLKISGPLSAAKTLTTGEPFTIGAVDLLELRDPT